MNIPSEKYDVGFGTAGGGMSLSPDAHRRDVREPRC
jgi:hypothetical protein